jgi:hypothetical protein
MAAFSMILFAAPCLGPLIGGYLTIEAVKRVFPLPAQATGFPLLSFRRSLSAVRLLNESMAQ